MSSMGFADQHMLPGTLRRREKRVEKEDSPLYRMEVLTSDVDTLMSSPSKSLDTFLPSEDEDDHEDTPITRKITVKGKLKVIENGRQVKTGKDLRKTKGVLLWENDNNSL